MTSRDSTSILIVDDDQDILEMMGLLLESAGYRVQTAEDGADALAKLRRGIRPSLILLDMMMPVMDGWAFRDEQLRDPGLANIPVVVFTGDARAEQKAGAVSAAGYLKKPVELETLVETVDRYAPHH